MVTYLLCFFVPAMESLVLSYDILIRKRSIMVIYAAWSYRYIIKGISLILGVPIRYTNFVIVYLLVVQRRYEYLNRDISDLCRWIQTCFRPSHFRDLFPWYLNWQDDLQNDRQERVKSRELSIYFCIYIYIYIERERDFTHFRHAQFDDWNRTIKWYISRFWIIEASYSSISDILLHICIVCLYIPAHWSKKKNNYVAGRTRGCKW